MVVLPLCEHQRREHSTWCNGKILRQLSNVESKPEQHPTRCTSHMDMLVPRAKRGSGEQPTGPRKTTMFRLRYDQSDVHTKIEGITKTKMGRYCTSLITPAPCR